MLHFLQGPSHCPLHSEQTVNIYPLCCCDRADFRLKPWLSEETTVSPKWCLISLFHFSSPLLLHKDRKEINQWLSLLSWNSANSLQQGTDHRVNYRSFGSDIDKWLMQMSLLAEILGWKSRPLITGIWHRRNLLELWTLVLAPSVYPGHFSLLVAAFNLDSGVVKKLAALCSLSL